MTRNLSPLSRRGDPYVKADHVNKAGFPSFTRSIEEAYLQMLLTNTLGGTYYAAKKDLVDGALQLHDQVTRENPEFAAKAIVYARNEGFMRLQPIVGLSYLKGQDKPLFEHIFPQVINTPGDLQDFVEVVRGNVVPGGMGRLVKRVINNWLNNMSEYHALKYQAGGQGYSLRDILRLTHPIPKDEKQKAIFAWIVDKDKWRTEGGWEHTPQLVAFENMKEAADKDPELVRGFIAEGRLPHEVVTGSIKPDAKTWQAIMTQMPFMALLRNLNTLDRHDVLKEKANRDFVVERLSNNEQMRRAKVLPFRLYQAYKAFQNDSKNVEARRAIDNVLLSALNGSFVNLPEIPGTVCIAPDVSGSMGGMIADRSSMRFKDVCGIFAGALLKANPDAFVLPFENDVKRNVAFSGLDSIMTTAERIANMGGGGTNLGAPVELLREQKISVDVFIGITDSEEWLGRGFLAEWKDYLREVNPNARAFLITIAPHRDAPAPADEPSIDMVYGWNDNVLNYINLRLSDSKTQVDYVTNLEI